MKILIFAPAFAPYMGSESLVTSKLVLILKQNGYEVDVISRPHSDIYSDSWHFPWSELKDCTFGLVPIKKSIIRTLWDRISDSIKLGYPLAGIRWAMMALELGRKLHLEKNYDIFISRSPPDIGHLPALKLSQETGVPLIANWNDPPLGSWPEPYDNGTLIQRIINKKLVREVLENSSINTFPSERLARYISQFFNYEAIAKLAIIPHAGPYNLLKTPVIKAQSVFHICHTGKLCNSRDLGNLFIGIQKFLESEKPAKGTFIFEHIGYSDQNISLLSKQYGVEDFVLCSEPLPYELTIQHLGNADISVLIEASCEEGIFLPGKFSDYVHVGNPILALSPVNGTIADLLSMHGGGLLADINSCDSVAEALVELYRSWKANKLEQDYSTVNLEKVFNAEAILDGYKKVFSQLAIQS